MYGTIWKTPAEHHEEVDASVAFLSYAYGDYLWYRLYSRLILTFFAIELVLKIVLVGPKEFYVTGEKQDRVTNYIDTVVIGGSVLVEFVFYSYL